MSKTHVLPLCAAEFFKAVCDGGFFVDTGVVKMKDEAM